MIFFFEMFPCDPEWPGTNYEVKVNFKRLFLLPCEEWVSLCVSKPTLCSAIKSRASSTLGKHLTD